MTLDLVVYKLFLFLRIRKFYEILEKKIKFKLYERE